MGNEISHFQSYPIPQNKPYVYEPFPRWVTPEGKSPRIVGSPEEFEAVMGRAWDGPKTVDFVAPTEATQETKVAESPTERDQLLAYCIETQIPVDKRWGVGKLKQAIEKHRTA